MLEGEINTTEIHEQKIGLLGLDTEWRLACYSKCTSDITLEIDQYNHLILADESEFEFVPQSGYGVAVDLGTTTLVAQLIDLSTPKVIAVETMLNPQAKFGADLISRIQACIDGNAEELKRLIRFSIGVMIELLLRKQKVTIQKIVLVGNTAMHHIFSGFDVVPLAQYPFETPHLNATTFITAELGWNFEVEDEIRFYPAIGSFVGSDILAGIAATGIHSNNEFTALIDLGTNGEIVVGNTNQLICASTAAGPAFEGTNISMGMRATTGAVSSFKLTDNKLIANVIGNTSPKGMCGSALVDAIALLQKMGNTALIGAKMFLFQDKNEPEKILSKTNHINLESHPDFQNIYVDKMLFDV